MGRPVKTLIWVLLGAMVKHGFSLRQPASLLAALVLLAMPLPVMAGAGHDHGSEFQTGAGAVGEVQVDEATAKRLDLRVEPVRRRPMAVGIQVTGQIEALPNQQVQVTTPVGGTVLKLLVKPGDSVTAGQPLAIMNSPQLAELRTTALDRRNQAIASLQQSQADLRLAQENYNQQQQLARAEINQAETAFRVAQERYDRDQELSEKGVLPRRQAQESEAQLAAARSALAKAKSRLAVAEAQAQLRRAQSAVQTAHSQLALSDDAYQSRLRQLKANANPDGTITIIAPIAGTVAHRETTTGESGEDAGKSILTLVNLQRVQVTANIYEKDLNQIRLGQTVQVQVASLPNQRFNATISNIGSGVDDSRRVVPVRAELANPAQALRPGMFANLNVFTGQTATPTTVIPATAVIETNDKRQIVFVRNGSKFAPTDVSLGRREGEFVEVTEGLFEGDQVVTQRANQLYTQSLRGGGAEDHQGHDHGSEGGQPAAHSAGLPWWWIVPAGLALGGGMFWAGSRWGQRSNRSNPESEPEVELAAKTRGRAVELPNLPVEAGTTTQPSATTATSSDKLPTAP
jgi:membrane fusion protein, heavy metal efflux system